MKTTFCFLLLLLFAFAVPAQNPLVKQWDKTYGGTLREDLNCLLQTADDGFILAGNSYSEISGDKTEDLRGADDFWLVKTNANGLKQWDKRFGGESQDELLSMQQTRDGGYILGGFSTSDSSGDKSQNAWPHLGYPTYDYWLVKIDSEGNKQWDKTLGGTGGDFLRCLQQTFDGGYILGGNSTSDSSGDKTQSFRGGAGDYWIIKVDSLGDKQWDKRYGASRDEEFRALLQTPDGGFLLAGSSNSTVNGEKSVPSWGNFDYWIVRIDSAGNKLWDNRYGGTAYEELHSVAPTTDGGFILGGVSMSGANGDKTEPSWGGYDYWMVKIDSAGNKQWDKRFGGTNYDNEYGNAQQTADGGYLISGTSYSPISGDKTENNLGQGQTWIIKTDSAGTKKWDKTIFTLGPDENSYALETRDGCYVMANNTIAGIGGYKTQARWDTATVLPTGDLWIIKFYDSTQHQCNLPPVAVAASQTSFCAGDSVKVCAPTGYAAYHWNNGNTDSCIQVKDAGNYYVTVSDSFGCSVESSPVGISVFGSPVINTSMYGDTLHVYNGLTYQWYLNGAAITGATDSIYVITGAGNYFVVAYDSNGCRGTSNDIVISAIHELNESTFTLLPNPVTNHLFIKTGKTISEINIYPVTGNLINPCGQLKDNSIDVSALPPGVYIAEIKSGDLVVRKKWIKM